jgi:hypothetical protein
VAQERDIGDDAHSKGDRTPALVKRIGMVLGALVMGGAFYLIAARGEAIIVDLTTMAERFWCF